MILLGMAAMLASFSPMSNIIDDFQNTIPTVNLTAIRYIACNDAKDPKNPHKGWTGSGSLIGHNIILTAWHVAQGGICYDANGIKLRIYYVDKAHDIALMTGRYPQMPYIKIGCAGYKSGHSYNAYGISGFASDIDMFRQVRLKYTGRHEDVDYGVEGAGISMAAMDGATVHGMSGGPYLDDDGYQQGIVNAGEDDEAGLPTGHSLSYELKDTILCRR